jgi:hypothetical protein
LTTAFLCISTAIRSARCEIDLQPELTILGPSSETPTRMEESKMSRYKPTLAFATALIFAGALQGCATYDKCGLEGCAGDANVTANVRALIDEHPELGPNSVDVQTLDHVVYLNGEVSTGMDSRTAESVALSAAGVTRVVNLISVTH